MTGVVHGGPVTEPLVWKGELWLCRLDHNDCILSVTLDILSMCRGRDGSKPGPAPNASSGLACVLSPAFFSASD